MTFVKRCITIRNFSFVIVLMGFGAVLCAPKSAFAQATLSPDAPAGTPIQHLIMLMQENHSFDNYFGTYPGANGIPDGVCMPVNPFDSKSTSCVAPFHIGDTEVTLEDPDHSTLTARSQYNDGLMNGFVYALNTRNQDGRLSMGYYDGRDLPYYWNIADQYVLFDNFFSSAAGGSDENHMFWVAANNAEVPDGPAKVAALNAMPTIFDRLQAKGISWKFYVQNYEPKLNYRTIAQFPGNRASQVIWVPLLNFDRFIDDPTLASHIVDINQYYDDLKNGTLPSVSFLVPSGPSEHPPSNILSGQRFVRTLIQSLMQANYWNNSAFVWAYDDWGGWYDHVPPPQVDDQGYGFRVPALLVSPYAKQGAIDHTLLDYTSILKFIEDNWGVTSLSKRDTNANSITSAFDFQQTPRPASFVPFDRVTTEETTDPNRIIVFITYGLAIILGVTLFMFAIRYPGRLIRIARKVEE